MEKLRALLVSTDLSPRANHALARAAMLARERGAGLTAQHVVARGADTDTLPEEWSRRLLGAAPATEDFRQRAREALQTKLDALIPGATPAQVQVDTGVPFVEVIRAARERNVDLVVLGAHGGHYIREWLLGTTAERVIHKGDRPVLVVKKPPKGPYRRLLVAVDFSETSKRALALAVRVAPKARLTLLNVYDFGLAEPLPAGGTTSGELLLLQQTYEQQRRERLVAFAREAGLDPDKAQLLVRYGYPGLVINAVAAEQRAHLVAVGTQGLSGLRYVLLGSVAEHVLRESRCDVLAVHPGTVPFELP
jgi:nucleotide-binding universal stress UspA family protein